MILLDVNVLVYAHREDAPGHRAYRRWLETALEGSQPCGISELVLADHHASEGVHAPDAA